MRPAAVMAAVVMLVAGCGQAASQGAVRAAGSAQTAVASTAAETGARPAAASTTTAAGAPSAHRDDAALSLAAASGGALRASNDAVWVSPPTTIDFGGVTSGTVGGQRRGGLPPVSQDPLVFVAHPSAEARDLLVSALTASSNRTVSGTMRYGLAPMFGMAAGFETDSDGDTRLLVTLAAPENGMGGEENLEFEMIVTASDGRVYARAVGDGSNLAKSVGWPDGWILLGDDAAGEAGFLCPPDPLTGGQAVCAAPNDYAALIGLVDVAEIAGHARVGGHDTTHVRFTAAAAIWDADDALLPESVTEPPPLAVPLNAWIDRHGLLRRIEIDTDAFAVMLSVLFDAFAADADADAVAQLLAMLRVEMSTGFESYQPVPDIAAPRRVAADFSALPSSPMPQPPRLTRP